MLLYFAPNLVQDYHRVFSHHHHHCCQAHCNTGIEVEYQNDDCALCVFQFNVIDEPLKWQFSSFSILISDITLNISNARIQLKPFHSYQLRAPPLT